MKKSNQLNILTCIVLYNKKLEDSKSYESLITGNEHNIFVFDNSPANFKQNKEYTSTINYVKDSSNPGLSHAYNMAAEYAKNKGYQWLLLADQDTVFPSNSFSIYKEAIKDNPNIFLFCPKVLTGTSKYMSPVRQNHYITTLSKVCPSGIIDPRKYGIINSGLLINVAAFEKVGGYNENVFLDYADFQFIERFSAKYHQAGIVNLELKQSFSNEEQTTDEKLNRYRLFCKSVKNYKPIHNNRFWIHFNVLKRALSLTLSSHRLTPLKIILDNYFS